MLVTWGHQSFGRSLCSLYSCEDYLRIYWSTFWLGMGGIGRRSRGCQHGRVLVSTINPPFFTSVLFGISLGGLTPKDSPTVTTWYRRAIYAVAIGTVIGWFTYMEAASVR